MEGFPKGMTVVLTHPKHPHSQAHKGELVKLTSSLTDISINGSNVKVQFYDRYKSELSALPAYDSHHAFRYPTELVKMLKQIGFTSVKGLYESNGNGQVS